MSESDGVERTCETEGCRRDAIGRAKWSSGGIDGEPSERWLCDPCLSVAEEVVNSAPSTFGASRIDDIRSTGSDHTEESTEP